MPDRCTNGRGTLTEEKIMKKTILVTGATDGIGLETVKALVSMGHNVLLHGRNQTKLENVIEELSILADRGEIESYVADLSRLSEVNNLAKAVAEKHEKLDVLINNAGIPVDIVFVLLVPENACEEHLKTLAELAELVQNAEYRNRLRKAETNRELFDAASSFAA